MRHVLLAEKALGKKLPKGVVVHHIDSNGLNNDPSNLVICPDEAYHQLLHLRMRALAECGNADWRKCPYCKEWDAVEYLMKTKKAYTHQHCRAAYAAKSRIRPKSP